MAKTKDFAAVIRTKLARDPKLADKVENERFRAKIAEQIYNARTAANLTQAELADLGGMQQSAIARLEDTTYAGHSLTTLEKIAAALNKRLEVKLVDDLSAVKRKRQAAV